MILAPGGPKMAHNGGRGNPEPDRDDARNEDAAARSESSSDTSRTTRDAEGIAGESTAARQEPQGQPSGSAGSRNEKTAARVESSSGPLRKSSVNEDEVYSKAHWRSKQVWSDERVNSPGTLAVLLVLATMMKDCDEVEIPQQRLADLARMTRASLNTHLNTAEALGYFVREPGQGRSPTLYRAVGMWMG